MLNMFSKHTKHNPSKIYLFLYKKYKGIPTSHLQQFLIQVSFIRDKVLLSRQNHHHFNLRDQLLGESVLRLWREDLSWWF